MFHVNQLRREIIGSRAVYNIERQLKVAFICDRCTFSSFNGQKLFVNIIGSIRIFGNFVLGNKLAIIVAIILEKKR